MHLIEDIKTIFRNEWKLFLLINIIYFGAVFAGALMTIADPGLQLSLISATGQSFGSGGLLSGVGDAYLTGNVPVAAVMTFAVNFFLGTLAQITIPSLILPFWALLFGVFRALLWGIMLIVPIPGVLPLSVLLPHYLTILLEGEAYVVAIFACTRGLVALVKPQAFGTSSRLKAYGTSIVDNGKLLAVVAALLAVAAVYEAVEVTYFAGTADQAPAGKQFGFYDEEFGAQSTYSNWTQIIPAHDMGWSTFDIPGGKPGRIRAVTDGQPLDVLVMDKGNFTVLEAGGSGWGAYAARQGAVNETFDFTLPRDDVYYIVMRNTGDSDVRIHMQMRYKK